MQPSFSLTPYYTPVLCCSMSITKLVSIRAPEQSLAVWVWRGPPSPVAGMSGPRSPASHGKEANTAFRSRPGKLKTVSSPTWISNEWQPRSLELLVSSGPEGISVQGFRLQRCYLLRIWKIKHGSPGSRMWPCRSQDLQAAAAKGLDVRANKRLCVRIKFSMLPFELNKRSVTSKGLKVFTSWSCQAK